MPDRVSTLPRDAPRTGGAADRRVRVGAAGSGARSGCPGPVFGHTELGRRLPEHLRTSRLIEPGQTVVLGVSGGLDSVVLLHAARFLLRPWRLSLVAAHFDHRMRPDSAGDAAWVAGVCRAWRVPFARGLAVDRRLRSEADARAARYRFLDDVADRRDADRIATAHHADDQAETVLFRAIRGTGLRGLTGIPARRDRVVRPLLPFPRELIADYAAAAGLRWRDDPSNLDVGYARNRLRHDILPRLEAIAPGTTRALVRLGDHAREAEAAWDSVLDGIASDVLEAESEHAIVLARPRLLAYHPHIQARLLRRVLARCGSRPDRAGTRAALAFIRSSASGGRFHVQGGVVVEREFERIRVRAPGAARITDRPDRSLHIRTPSAGSGTVVVGGRAFRVRWAGSAERHDGEDAAFDPEALRFPLELRAWRPGDRLRLPYGTKKLKKLFVERRVGRSARARVPVLVDADERVLWVVGVQRSAEAAPVEGRSAFRIVVNDRRSS